MNIITLPDGRTAYEYTPQELDEIRLRQVIEDHKTRPRMRPQSNPFEERQNPFGNKTGKHECI